jgi:zinc transport system substrate-binding protein
MTNFKIKTPFLSFALLLFWIWIQPISAHLPEKIPNVVVSITPFYGLVATIMQGVGTPTLLVKPGASVHHHALKSSDMKALENAALVVWGGHDLEIYLIKPLQTLKTRTQPTILTLRDIPTLSLLDSQSGHCGHAHAHTSDASTHAIDMHFWLDPLNAMAISQALVDTLSKLDPIHATLYKKNGEALKKDLRALDNTISEKLKTVNNVPFIVFHDAYQYFSHRYNLKIVGIITTDPELSTSAKRLKNILNVIQTTKAKCIFTEPNTRSTLVKNLVQDSPINMSVLDPEGNQTMQNNKGYFLLLNNLTDSLKECLERPILQQNH